MIVTTMESRIAVAAVVVDVGAAVVVVVWPRCIGPSTENGCAVVGVAEGASVRTMRARSQTSARVGVHGCVCGRWQRNHNVVVVVDAIKAAACGRSAERAPGKVAVEEAEVPMRNIQGKRRYGM